MLLSYTGRPDIVVLLHDAASLRLFAIYAADRNVSIPITPPGSHKLRLFLSTHKWETGKTFFSPELFAVCLSLLRGIWITTVNVPQEHLGGRAPCQICVTHLPPGLAPNDNPIFILTPHFFPGETPITSERAHVFMPIVVNS